MVQGRTVEGGGLAVLRSPQLDQRHEARERPGSVVRFATATGHDDPTRTNTGNDRATDPT
jgi:hypothetical protein